MDAAWRDHRQSERESFCDAERDAYELLARHPELIIREEYSREITICAKCQDIGPFQRALPETIVKALGYW
jgi:hypothetical protein